MNYVYVSRPNAPAELDGARWWRSDIYCVYGERYAWAMQQRAKTSEVLFNFKSTGKRRRKARNRARKPALYCVGYCIPEDLAANCAGVVPCDFVPPFDPFWGVSRNVITSRLAGLAL